MSATITHARLPQGGWGVAAIGEERTAQVEKGYTPDHDDEHGYDELLRAAGAYMFAATHGPVDAANTAWPWDEESYKPSDDPERNLTKAGALIAAAIDCIERDRIETARAAVEADDHYKHPEHDGCAVCPSEWHDDRCGRWCEGDEIGAWCHDCLSYAD